MEDIEDILLIGGQFVETPSGDLQTVTGIDEVRQSIYREIPAVRGSIPYRPNWGGGLNGIVMQSRTRENLDRAATTIRSTLIANPRITRVNEVSVIVDNDDVTVVIVRVDTKFGPDELRSAVGVL